MSQQLNKDLRAIRHRASELSKAIENIFRYPADRNWESLINQCSVISQQLLLLQADFERGILIFPSKFMVQPLHEHFDCEILGVKKMPQIEANIMQYTQPISMPASFIKHQNSKQSDNKRGDSVDKESSEEIDATNKDEWSDQTMIQLMTRISEFNDIIAKLYEYNKEKSGQIRAQTAMKSIKQESKSIEIKKEVKKEEESKEAQNTADTTDNTISQSAERLDYAQKLVSYMFCGEMPRRRVSRRLH